MKITRRQAYRRKKDPSVHVAAAVGARSEAQGMVSAGNTGAVMTVARFLLGTLERRGSRGAGGSVSERKGGVSVMLDVGANVDSKPSISCSSRWMGDIYYRATFAHGHGGRVGLLSIGEEEIKGQRIDAGKCTAG